jgi:D-threo-aldose 1-dehydrogenase
MKTRTIGKTNLEVTEFGFGCAAIGGLYRTCLREDAMAVMQSAWDNGFRYFDAAPFYGFGLAERRVGDFLRDQTPGSYVLSTKVGRLLSPVDYDRIPDHSYVDPLPFDVAYDYSYDGIMRSVEFSHARLGLNKIDILYVHDIGAYTHGEEANRLHFRQLMDSGLKALEELKSSGTISAFGLGVNEVQVCLDVMNRATIDCILLAGRYTLLDRAAEAELLPLCEKSGTSLVIGGVFNSGILATGPVAGSHFDYAPASPEVIDKVTAMGEVAKAAGLPLAAPALHFPLRQKAVASVLLGTAKVSSLMRNLDMLGTAIPDNLYKSFEPYVLDLQKGV